MSRSWLQTWTGKKFFPLDADPADINLRDIARSLSMLCRFVGHVDRFYSVAEHSVRMSEKAEERGFDIIIQRQCLVHDAAEAYLGDVSRPVKMQDELAGYRVAESVLQVKILRALELPPYLSKEVDDLDLEILGTEAYYLKSPIHPDWCKSLPGGVLAPPWTVGWFDRLGWSPAKAEKRFLQRLRYLWRLGES